MNIKKFLYCLKRFFLKFWFGIIGSLFLSVSINGLGYLLPIINIKIIDDGLLKESFDTLLFYVIVLSVLSLLIHAMRAFSQFWDMNLKFKMEYTLKPSIMKELIKSTENDDRLGEFEETVSSDIDMFMTFVTDLCETFFPNIVSLVLSVIILFRLQWKLSIIVIFFQIVTLILQLENNKKIEKNSVQIRKETIKLFETLNEIVNNIKVLYFVGAAKYALEKYKNNIKSHYDSIYEQMFIEKKVSAISYLLTTCNNMTILLLGGYFVIHGEMTIGKLISFYQYISSFATPFVSLISVSTDFSKSKIALFNIIDLLECLYKNKEKQPVKCKNNVNQIEIKNLTFSYGNHIILENMDVLFKKKNIYYIVGRTGIGKTTFTKLLLGLLKPIDGKIYFDGRQIDSIDREGMISLVSWLPQDNIIFNDTVKNNITLGAESSDEQVINLLKACSLESDLNKFSDGLNTCITENGNNLSGGQKRRICLARALFSDKPIMIIDEATTGLDKKTELFLRKTLENYSKNKILIVISHSEDFIINNAKVYELRKHRLCKIDQL